VPLAKRPEGERLLAKVGKGDVVITARLDRAFRSAADALGTLEEMKDQGVALHMIDLGGDVCGNGISKLVFTILSAMGENERDRIRERIRFIQTSSFVVFSIVLVSRQQRGGCGLRCSAAILCACLSSFGVSAGLLVWPVLTWSAWRNRLGPSWTGIIAGAGVIFVWLYLWKMPARTYQSLFNLENFVASVDYGIRFLGLPWSHAAELVWPARLVGAMLLVLGILIVLRQSVVKNGATPQRIGAALILFTFLCAGAAAISRVDIPGPTSVRYAMFVVLAHLGLFLFALPYLEKMWEYGRSRWCLVAAIVLSGGWLAHQMLVGRMATRETGHYNDAWARFIAGEWTPDMIHYVYPDREQAIAKLAYLRDNHVGWTLTPSAPGRR
jgi:hypothetical protein